MVKFFMKTEGGEPEEVPFNRFVQGIQREFMFGDEYRYEYTMMLLGHGNKIVGSFHMFWIEW